MDHLARLLQDPLFLSRRLQFYRGNGALFRQESPFASSGHLGKAKHNLRFVADNIPLNYFDWCVTGCYYAIYHAALALIAKKLIGSKNHDATLCALIKEYRGDRLQPNDFELLNKLYLTNHDLLFYVRMKQKREKATYATSAAFTLQAIKALHEETSLFVEKAEDILG